MNKKILTSVISIVMITAMVLTGCSTSNTTKTDSNSNAIEKSAAKDSLVFRLNSEPSTLDPHMTSDVGVTQNAQYQLFDSLTREEQDGTLSPALAESWKISEDGKEVILKIRQNIKFHNGDILTADDVVFSLKRAVASKFNTVMTSSIEKVEKVDDTTVKLTLKYAYSPILKCLATINMSILPQKVVEANPEGFARNPVGTGAYVFKEWKSGDKVIMEAFADYYRGTAAIKNLTYVNIPDHSTALIALEKGEIDVMINPNMADRQSIIDNKNLVYHESDAAAYQLFSFNNEKGVFADKRLRKAVSMVVDREAIIIGAKEGQATPVEAAMLTIVDEYPEGFKSDAYDVEAAKQLVIDAGYPNGLTVKMPTIDAATYIKPSTMLQEMVREIGINIEIEIMERGAWNQKVLTDTDYEITMWAVPVTVVDADFAAYGPFHSKNRGGSGNFTNVNIPRLDELVEKGRVTPAGVERNAIYKEISEIIRDEAVLVPFLAGRRELPASAKLKGISANPTMRYYIYDASWAE